MKKFLFSLTMLAAVALAGFTTSCGGGDDDGDGDKVQNLVFDSKIDVKAGVPNSDMELVDLGTIYEDVNITLYTDQNKLDFCINGLNLGEIAEIPPALQTPFDIDLKNVPCTKNGNEYKIDYNLPVSENGTTDIKIKISEFGAYLVNLNGTIKDNKIDAYIYVLGDEDLMSMPVNIYIDGTQK